MDNLSATNTAETKDAANRATTKIINHGFYKLVPHVHTLTINKNRTETRRIFEKIIMNTAQQDLQNYQ